MPPLALVDELLDWTRGRKAGAARSLRFVWEVEPRPGGLAALRVTARVTSHRLADEPRRLEQLRQLHGDVQRGAAALAPPQEALLAALLDGCVRTGGWGDVVPASVAVAMLRAVDDPGPLMTWAPDLAPAVCARAGVAAGEPLRLGGARVRLLPAAGATEDGARFDLACLWPDGRWRWLRELVYLPSADYPRAAGAVLADGSVWVVAEEPPAGVRDRFLSLGGVAVPRAQCGELLAPLAQRFPHVQAALAAHTRRLGGTPIVALDLRDDDWLQLRVFLHCGDGDWLPGDDPGAAVLELGPDEHADLARLRAATSAFVRLPGGQEDERAGVFLISLKAGGTGLNLTAASYVVLFDPWWNPAVEAQAIDRSHRIGQDRTVIAYRLIARGTIEEKIWELQQRKAAMVRDILGEDGFARALDRAALEFLLQEVRAGRGPRRPRAGHRISRSGGRDLSISRRRPPPLGMAADDSGKEP